MHTKYRNHNESNEEFILRGVRGARESRNSGNARENKTVGAPTHMVSLEEAAGT